MDVETKIKLGLAAVVVGIPVVWLFSKSSLGKDLGKQAADGITSLTKGLVKGLGKPLGKSISKGAVVTYNKALKPFGKTIFNKALKPGFKELKNGPKKLVKSLGKKKTWKKIFRL